MSNRHRANRPHHKNTYAYTHNPHSKKTDKILSFPNEGVCHKCWEQIEWRKKFRKYKPLTVARRCDACQMKAVRIAYHCLCQECATEKGVCAKCAKEGMSHPYVVLGSEGQKDEEAEALLKMSERQRRTYLRELEREQRGASKKKSSGGDEIDSFSEGDDSDDDGLGDMPLPPPRKFDPDMLVKERAARAGKTLPQESAEEEDEQDPEDDDGAGDSAESFEDDSDEIDRVEEDAKKLVGKKDKVEKDSPAEEDHSNAGSGEEDDEDEE